MIRYGSIFLLIALLAACGGNDTRMLVPPSEPPEPLLVPPAIAHMSMDTEDPTPEPTPERTTRETRERTRETEILRVADATDVAVEDADPPATSGDDRVNFFHITVADESLDTIARRYGVSVQALAELNALAGTSPPQGRVLLLPRDRTHISRAPDVTTYTVVRGDTYSSIARRFRISTHALMHLNNAESSLLQIDDVLYVPDTVRR